MCPQSHRSAEEGRRGRVSLILRRPHGTTARRLVGFRAVRWTHTGDWHRLRCRDRMDRRGLGSSSDAEVVTVEADAERTAIAQAAGWPSWVNFITGDVLPQFPSLGRFDLIFADAIGGKWHGFDHTVSALASNGLLVLDDLRPQDWRTPVERQAHLDKMDELRSQIDRDPRLISVELDTPCGIILTARTAEG